MRKEQRLFFLPEKKKRLQPKKIMKERKKTTHKSKVTLERRGEGRRKREREKRRGDTQMAIKCVGVTNFTSVKKKYILLIEKKKCCGLA